MRNLWVTILFMMLVGLAGTFGHAGPALAEDDSKPWVSKVISLQGSAMVNRHGQADWAPIQLNSTLFPGDRLQVEANSRVGIVLRNDAVLRLDQNTTLVFTAIEQETRFIFRLLKGAANFFSHRPSSLKIFTPFVNGVVEGTEFYVQVDADQTRIDLFEGRILAENSHGELQLAKGQGAVATSDTAPQRRILVQPRDSVQWALYYPPVMALGQADLSDPLEQSLDLFNQGRHLDAIDALNRVEDVDQDSTFYAYRAGLLLHLGRVTKARDDLQQALDLDPDNGEALALQAIIAVVQNKKEEALAIAQKAVQQSSSSAAAHIALSYAQQAAFNLSEALNAAQAAVDQAPESSTARARLAELRLSTGELNAGVEAARKAVELNPNAAHAHTILGFAYLTQIKTDEAKTAFEKAITLDSAAPLPRLGLGLAIIRDGDLELGRAQIEIAAGLDPANAMIRSYLGKAYFDEKRSGQDQEQLEIAKRLDPNDPTPWLYDAIRKQTINRPVDALQSLQKSMALNDNRAVYRSRLMLDEDQAARGVSLARIYDDLGFNQRALVESTKSLSMDPTNHSAHRFLADTYIRLPQHQIAQVSERLQAQLLQPVNVNPVQPRLSQKSLKVVSSIGVGEAALNEFTPLFERNGPQLTMAGIGGINNTSSEEVVLSGLADSFSYSLGQFYYHTDGFREESDIEHEIYNAFSQIAVSNKVNIQFEYRRRDTTQGDLRLSLDPELVMNHSRDLEQDIWRGGLHLSPSPQSDIIASLLYSDHREGFSQVVPSLREDDVVFDGDGFNAETQYLFHANRFNLILGCGLYRVDAEKTLTATIEGIPLPPPLDPIPGTVEIEKENVEYKGEKLYLYTKIRLPANLSWTLGFSYEAYEEIDFDTDLKKVLPKFGVEWDITKNIRFSTVYVENIKRLLAVDQTIEPTQVAGFNQFFDDRNGSLSKLSGVALDASLKDTLYMGLQHTRRDLSEVSELKTDLYRWYVSWAAHPDWSVHAEYLFERDRLAFELETTSVPLSIRYFSSNGLYGQLGSTFVWQEEKTARDTRLSDDFVVVDATVGFRLPNRLGVFSLEIGNLMDQDFNYRDADFKTSDKLNVIQPFWPERTVVAKIVLNF